MDDFFYINKVIHYIKNNIYNIPLISFDDENINDNVINTFINNCCNIIKQHNIQIFISIIFIPVIKNKELIASVYVDLLKNNLIKSIPETKINEKKIIQNEYTKFKNIFNSINITQRIIFISYQNENKYTKYLFNNLIKCNLTDTRIIKHYVNPLYKFPESNDIISVYIFNNDLNNYENNFSFLNINKILIKQKVLNTYKNDLIYKLGQFYTNILFNKIDIIETSFNNNLNRVNKLNISLTNFIKYITDSIKKCVMCTIYDKHCNNLLYINNFVKKKGYYCDYCNNIFNKNNFKEFVINNLI